MYQLIISYIIIDNIIIILKILGKIHNNTKFIIVKIWLTSNT